METSVAEGFEASAPQGTGRKRALSEGAFVSLVIIAVMVATAIPYAYAWWQTPVGFRFTGIAPFSPPDTNTYLAWIYQAREGRTLLVDLYTTEPQRVGLFLPLYVLLGRISALSGLSMVAAYHAARVILGVLLLLIGYRFARAFLPDPGARRVALFLMAFSSGWGALIGAVTGTTPATLDMVAAEGLVFTSVMGFPHFIAGMLLLLLVFGALLRSFRTGQGRWAAGAGVAASALAMIHPFDLAVAYLVPAVYLLVERARPFGGSLRCYLIFLLAALPGVAYMLVTAHSDPVLERLSREVLPPPGLWWYVGGYGFVLIFALVGLHADWRARCRARLLPAVWWAVCTALVYLPLFSQRRRLIEGLHLPLCILAAHGITLLAARLGSRRSTAAFLLTGLSTFGTLALVASSCVTYRADAQRLFYLPVSVEDAGAWLHSNAPPGTAVLAAAQTSNYLPRASGARVYAGHFHLTLDYQEKVNQVRAFYRASTTDAERRSLVRSHGILFVVHGPFERALGGFRPDRVPWLSWEFESGTGVGITTLYRVRM